MDNLLDIYKESKEKDMTLPFDISMISTIVGTGMGIIAFVYAFVRNFKQDLSSSYEKMEKRIDSLEERIFFLASGKSLQQAILQQKLKKEVVDFPESRDLLKDLFEDKT